MIDQERSAGAGGQLGRTRVTIAAGPLMAPVLARLFGIYAARAALPVDRLSDTLLIADALAARAPTIAEHGRVPLSIVPGAGRFEIRIGPLAPGGGQRLLEGAHLPDTGPMIERLVDDVHIRSGAGGGEVLVLRLNGRL